mgnify:CR=1 FL=1
MASIKVSELPAVSAITPADVLIINDEDLVTSSITISLFTSSFTGQDLSFTGDTSFSKPVTFTTGSLPTFDSPTVFSQQVTFNGPIVLGSLAQIPLGSLSNVTLPASIPTGEVLTWDLANGYWTSKVTGDMNDLVDDTTPQLGGNLACNGYSITSDATNAGTNGSNIELDPNGAGVVVFQGNSTRGAGQFKLNCEATTHGITVKGPPHSAAANYTFIFPVNMGTSGQVLITDGTNTTSWSTITPAGIGAATAAQGVKADTAMQVAADNNIPQHADNTAAANAGLTVGALYHTADGTVKVRV